MAEAYYEPTPATDSTFAPVPGATFQVFELADKGVWANPLSLRVGAGNPSTTVEVTAPLGTLPGVHVTSPNFKHIWKSGTFEWERHSIDGAEKAIEEARIAASSSQSSADQAATNAAASAQAASNAAALVDAPADQVLADLAANPASQFGTQINATIADRIGGMGQRTTKLSMVPSVGVFGALTNTRSKIAGLRAGTGTLKALCIGDSTTHGNDSTKAAGPWNTTSWPKQAAQILTNDGYPAQSGLGIAPSYSDVSIDGRWTLGSGWSQLKTADIGWGTGVCVRTSNATTAAGTAVFNPGTSYNKVDVYYTISSNASFQAVVDVIVGGVTLGQINNAGAGGIGKLTLTPAAATTSAVTLDGVSGGAIYILGIDCYTANGVIRVSNAGVSGSSTFDWKNDNGGYASLDCIRAYAPDLTIINLGINDSGWTPARAVAGVVADLTTLGTVADATGDVILTSFVPSAENSDKDETVQPGYWAEIKALAASKGWGYIDLAARYEDYPTASARGWMSDLVHPNSVGYQDMAYAVADVIEAVYQEALL